jgi:hypothetical protein
MGVVNSISNIIRKQEWKNPDSLTNLRYGPKLIVAMDFGGEHKAAGYTTFSLLIADAVFLWLWEEMRVGLRKTILGRERTVSYKKLGDKIRAKSLVPFLRAANCIPGVLITFAIHKGIQTLFRRDEQHESLTSPIVNPNSWKTKPFEKLLRAAHLSGIVIAGFSKKGQDILWVTDEDEIFPNDELHTQGCKLVAHVTSHYLSHDLGRFQTVTTKNDDGSKGLEDLVAISDLAAGCISDIATTMAAHSLDNQLPMCSLRSLSIEASKKSKAILGWMAETRHPLKKIVISIDPHPVDTLKVKTLTLSTPPPIPEYDWSSEFSKRLYEALIIPSWA